MSQYIALIFMTIRWNAGRNYNGGTAMNEQLNSFLTGLGVMAESTKASYDAFIKTGFKPEQAIFLACELMKELLRMSTQKKPEED